MTEPSPSPRAIRDNSQRPGRTAVPLLLTALFIAMGSPAIQAQQGTAGGETWVTPRGVLMDPDRARMLYVNNDPADQLRGSPSAWVASPPSPGSAVQDER